MSRKKSLELPKYWTDGVVSIRRPLDCIRVEILEHDLLARPRDEKMWLGGDDKWQNSATGSLR